jgi:hypothetical protein
LRVQFADHAVSVTGTKFDHQVTAVAVEGDRHATFR